MDRPKELTITCAHGVEPHLLELEQHSTYRGLLDGGPTHELNAQLLEEITSNQGRIPTYLVRPTERLVEQKRPSPFGPLMFLPRRQCARSGPGALTRRLHGHHRR